jgi:cell division protease FtsH
MSESNRVADLLGGSKVIEAGKADVDRVRERSRKRRIWRLFALVGAVEAYLLYREVTHNPFRLPTLSPEMIIWLPLVLITLLWPLMMIMPFIFFGRSPHILVRPGQVETGLNEVAGLDPQVHDVVHTLNVFLGYSTFRKVLGGTPRRGVLFEGPPGTGKTYLAKAMAKQAGVPFLFVSAPAFQSMFFGMTGLKIRAFFRALRRQAKKEGGAIGFIEEIDAIAGDRGGVAMSPIPDGVRPSKEGREYARGISRFFAPAGNSYVNELLIQMQSFDQPNRGQRLRGWFANRTNAFLPPSRHLNGAKPEYHNILLVGATNRASALDPALLRPGRLDRHIYFDPPTKRGRRDLLDFFLARKAHHPELDLGAMRDELAQDTFGHTPAMLEHLMDEALIIALQGGRDRMSFADIMQAKLTEEVGLTQDTLYVEAERRAVATHEAGHAVVAFLLGKGRKLEVLSIIKRRQALGLLAHTETEERFTKSRSELETMVSISLGGMAAEELFLGESGTGPGADLAQATELAATMIGALGMGTSLVSLEAVHEGYVAQRNLVGKVLGDSDGKAQVSGLLDEQKERAREALDANRDLVEALRDALLERDELIGEEITGVIQAALDRRAVVVVPEAQAVPTPEPAG